jgi:cell division transport system permease protein
MTWGQAIAYFFSEALLSLRRGWRVSLLAVLTIAVSLFLAGLFALVGHNLRGQIELWRGEARVVVYFTPEATTEALSEARRTVLDMPWVETATIVSREDARARFAEAFPDLVDILDDPDAEPLPPSLEVRLTPAAAAESLSEDRQQSFSALPGADWVDDDRAWLDRLESFIRIGRAVGWGLGGLLLAAAIFTISSVIRLTAYRYRDEIAVMRQIGATELLIRCPFYLEGCMQGFAGGLMAVLGLWWVYAALGGKAGSLSQAFLGQFLPFSSVLAFLMLGTAAGAIGAVTSLRREFAEIDPVAD